MIKVMKSNEFEEYFYVNEKNINTLRSVGAGKTEIEFSDGKSVTTMDGVESVVSKIESARIKEIAINNML